MRRARWLVPLILLLPLAAPAPHVVAIDGRAYEMRDDAPEPTEFRTTLTPLDDGISYATSRVLAGDAPALPPGPSTDWSYGPAHYSMPETALESGGASEPSAPAPSAPAPSEPATAPSTASPPPPLAPVEPPADEPTRGEEEGAADAEPAAACAGLCFSLELGLL